MTELFLERPEHWPLLLGPVLLAVLVFLAARRRAAMRAAFADVAAHRVLVADAGPRGQRRRAAFELSGLGLLALAALQPAFGWTLVKVERRGVDVVVCLDTSRSMTATDMAPSRAGRARRDLHALLPGLRGDRIALVAFAGDARVVCPLTHDLAAFESLLADVDEKATRKGGTNLGAALRAALALLPADAAQSQVILVLSDGEDLEGQGQAEAESARRRGVQVHAIGYGTPQGAKVRAADGKGFLRDEQGQDVITRMDAQGMRQLAESCGGVFLAAEAHPLPVLEVFDKRVRPLVQRRFEEETKRRPRARFQWLLLPGLLCLLIAFVDPGRMRRRAAAEAA
jgi:Ca-activated chloride channel family protein